MMQSHEQLIEAYLNEELVPEEGAQLEQWLMASESHRHEFALRVFEHRIMLDAMQGQAGHTTLVDHADDDQPTRLVRAWDAVYGVVSNYIALSALVSALFLTIILLSMAQIVPDWKRFVPGNELEPPSVEFVAHIAQFQQTIWDEASDGNLKNRDLFDDDRLILKQGLAVITYGTGASVILEGPVTYKIQGANAGNLQHGKLVARVEGDQAQGFTIETPHGRVEDRGTEFGVTVSDEEFEVTVFEGRVVAWSAAPGALPVELITDQTAIVDKNTKRPQFVTARRDYVQNMRDVFSGVIQIDFGATGVSYSKEIPHKLDESASRTTMLGSTIWNGVVPGESGSDRPAGKTQRFADLKDANGNPTDIVVQLTWSNQEGVDFSRAWNLLPPVRDGDFIGLRGDNDNIYNTITLKNLIAGSKYDVTVWTVTVTGFRVNGGDPVMVSGAANQRSTINNGASHTFSNAVVNERGELVVDWGRIGTDQSGEDIWTNVTALSIEPVRNLN